ncbi:MAG: RNA polymerase sigma factor [Kofleriaceae bacterium]
MWKTASLPSEGVDALTTALAAGDDDRAMQALVETYGELVYRYCRRMLGNDADGDDVAQTVFVQAFSDIKNLSRVRNARAWLLAVSRHRCLDRLKTVRRRAQSVADEELRSLADVGAAAQLPEPLASADPRVTRALDECLDRLDARSRALLVLRFHDELSYDEISELTSDSAGSLRVRMARALPALRQCLESKGVQP